MTHIPVVGQDRAMNSSATYNAVKIQINNPKTNVPEDFCPKCENNNNYNAVNIEVNDPAVEAEKKSVYDYPESKELVTYDQAFVKPKKLPPLPAPLAYQIINNRTFVNAEFEIEQAAKEAEEKVAVDEEVTVPEANYTTTENEKASPESALSFHGHAEEAEQTEEAPAKDVAFKGEEVENSGNTNNVNFKATKPIEIVPPEEIKPEVDVNKIVENLNSEDYDTQAKQIYDIVTTIKQNPEKAENYVVTDIFSSLTDIVKKDVSNLEQPDETKNDLRKKYIINEIVKEQARLNGEDPEKAELPYTLTDEEKASAVKLTDIEMAERNKDYALTALAVLAKTYADGVEKQSGNTVPLTDLPGVSACVDTLRYGTNPDIKVKAVEALMYINRPEYKDELKSIVEISTKDENPEVAMISTAAVQYLNEQ